MAQTTMNENPAVAYPGMPADIGFKDDRSKVVEEASGISPGLVVVRGTGDHQVSLPSAAFTDAAVVGLSVRTHKARFDFSADDAEDYLDEESIPVRRKGRIWVTVENAFSAGDPVFGRHSTGSGTTIGAVRTDDDTATASQVNGARLVTSGAAGELGLVEINLP